MIKNPNDVVTALVGDFMAAFGDQLSSVTMFGSAVSHEFVPGRSPISLLVILSDVSLKVVGKGAHLHGRWMRRGINPPLYLTAEKLSKLAVTCPIKILDMQHGYRVLYGNDALAPVFLHKENLLLQCKHELADVSIYCTTVFIRFHEHRHELELALVNIVIRLLPVFKALLVLYDKKIPNSTTEIIAALEDLFGLGSSVVSDVYISSGTLKKTIFDAFNKFYDTICSMQEQLNKLTIDAGDGATNGTGKDI